MNNTGLLEKINIIIKNEFRYAFIGNSVPKMSSLQYLFFVAEADDSTTAIHTAALVKLTVNMLNESDLYNVINVIFCMKYYSSFLTPHEWSCQESYNSEP